MKKIFILHYFLYTLQIFAMKLPQELWLTIATKNPTLQTLGRLKCVNKELNEFITFKNEKNNLFSPQNLRLMLLQQDFKSITNALISCSLVYYDNPYAARLCYHFFKYHNYTYKRIYDYAIQHKNDLRIIPLAIVMQQYGKEIKPEDNYKWLQYAITNNDLKLQKLILSAEKSILYDPFYKKTMLMHACQCADLDTIKILLNLGVDVNLWDKQHNTALHFTSPITYVGKEITELLLQAGADPTIKNHDKKTAINFHDACEANMTNVVKLLLNTDKNLITLQDKNGAIGLHRAAHCNQTTETIELLYNNNSDVNAKTSYNFTPLHYALFNGNHQIILYLIQHGADKYAINNNGDSPYSLITLEQNDILKFYPATIHPETKKLFKSPNYFLLYKGKLINIFKVNKWSIVTALKISLCCLTLKAIYMAYHKISLR